MQYPKQLPASAIQGCMSRLLFDIALIGDDDLNRSGKVDLVMAGWPCQGHYLVGFGQGLQDPCSSFF
jgi:site-specific DNA-cytosine methylase